MYLKKACMSNYIVLYINMHTANVTWLFMTAWGAGKRAAALTDVLDLAGIAACDGHIVSPSTFSW